MIIEVMTWVNHGFTNEDGSQQEHHCCGCWHVKFNEDDPFRPYIRCNECGEIRYFKEPGGSDAPPQR